MLKVIPEQLPLLFLFLATLLGSKQSRHGEKIEGRLNRRFH